MEETQTQPIKRTRTQAPKSQALSETPKVVSLVPSNQDKIDALIRAGVEVSDAKFHAAVNNADDVPESNFSSKSNNASRRAEMWWTQAGLLCKQKNKFFIVPSATVIFANFK